MAKNPFTLLNKFFERLSEKQEEKKTAAQNAGGVENAK